MIIVAPYAAKLRDKEGTNPKNYPHWTQLLALLRHRRFQVAQIGITGEERLQGVDYFYTDLTFPAIEKLIENCDVWISVDSWLPHFCHARKLKGGIVLWGQGDPSHWSYPENVNLLKDKKYLRKAQFEPWEWCKYNADAFVQAQEVVWKIDEVIKRHVPEMLLTADLRS